MGKIIAELSPGQSAGHDPWAWGSKCRPRRAGITGREVPWEPKLGTISKNIWPSENKFVTKVSQQEYVLLGPRKCPKEFSSSISLAKSIRAIFLQALHIRT